MCANQTYDVIECFEFKATFFIAAFVRDEELGSEEEELSDEEEDEEEEQEKDDDKQTSEVNVNTNENSCENDNDNDDNEDDSEKSDDEEESENHEPENDSVFEAELKDQNKKQKLLDKYKNLPGKKALKQALKVNFNFKLRIRSNMPGNLFQHITVSKLAVSQSETISTLLISSSQPITPHFYCPEILQCQVTDLIWLRYHAPLAEYGCGKYLIVPFRYASAAYQARLVSP